jgi:hypothetical protein
MNISTQFVCDIVLLLLVLGFYAVFRLLHEYAEVSSEFLETILEGYSISAVFWGCLIFIGIIGSFFQNYGMIQVLSLILGTRIFYVTFFEVSATILTIVYGVDKSSHGQIDYTRYAIIIVAVVAVVLFLFYYLNGFPPRPLTYP